MAQALITINGTPGTLAGVVPGTTLNLSNQDAGGETTYLWTILYQPPGTADSISNVNIKSPTITCNKEGTYRIQLQVNGGPPPSTLQNIVVIEVPALKSGWRVPAGNELAEADPNYGWAETGANQALRDLDGRLNTPVVCVAQIDASVTAAGQVVALNASAIIKTGLPGQEYVAVATAANPADQQIGTWQCGIVLGTVAGGAFSAGVMVRVLLVGVYQATFTFSSSTVPTAGQPIYLVSTGTAGLAYGPKKIGYVLSASLISGSNYKVVALVTAGSGGSVAFSRQNLNATTAGDVLPTVAPTNGVAPDNTPAHGYIVQPNYLALLATFLDQTTPSPLVQRAINIWIYDTPSQAWSLHGQFFAVPLGSSGGNPIGDVSAPYKLDVAVPGIYYQQGDSAGLMAIWMKLVAQIQL